MFLSTIILTGQENYYSECDNIRLHLLQEGLWDHIMGTATAPIIPTAEGPTPPVALQEFVGEMPLQKAQHEWDNAHAKDVYKATPKHIPATLVAEYN